MKTSRFLQLLEQEAVKQAELEKTSLLPKNLNFLASFFIRHMWQSLALISFILAVIKVVYEK
ncbi:MAG: hypothetical protein IT416_01465 [Candidatus Pacebacteria bacterium]|nr:hypothetical protein [Candidatus Paceibacterota bacterium]